MKLKKLLPRSLFGRFLLIIVIPTLIVQIVSIYVFFYVYVDVISKQLARSVVAEMEFIKNSVTKPTYQGILQDFSRSVDLYFYFEQKHYLKHKAKIADSKWKRSRIYQYVNLFPIIDPLNRFKSELSGRKLVPYEIFKLEGDNDILVTKVQTEAGIISFEVQEKRITSSTKYVFILWMFITALITSLISIAFLRNQMRPIKLLSKAAEKFGRGQDAPDFKISGSREIRSVAISFLKMKERIIRQISQRTDMLSAVSHDLRTPLTRMKLQLEMLGDSQEVSELKHDITDMEKLIEEYLNFARFEDREKTDLVNIKQFLQKIVDSYARMGKEIAVNISALNDFEMPIKKIALKRALMNLIDNGFNYGSNVALNATLSQNNLILTIEDDGPSIPEEEHDKVFKPFYRIDNSRNLDRAKNKKSNMGSGLGLAIAMDAVTSHGGRIRLADSEMGGLKLSIFIPI